MVKSLMVAPSLLTKLVLAKNVQQAVAVDSAVAEVALVAVAVVIVAVAVDSAVAETTTKTVAVALGSSSFI
jgi:hypothetical protein